MYLLEPKDGRNNRHEAWHDEYCRIHRSLWSWTTKCTSAGGEECTVGKTRAVGQQAFISMPYSRVSNSKTQQTKEHGPSGNQKGAGERGDRGFKGRRVQSKCGMKVTLATERFEQGWKWGHGVAEKGRVNQTSIFENSIRKTCSTH